MANKVVASFFRNNSMMLPNSSENRATRNTTAYQYGTDCKVSNSSPVAVSSRKAISYEPKYSSTTFHSSAQIVTIQKDIGGSVGVRISIVLIQRVIKIDKFPVSSVYNGDLAV